METAAEFASCVHLLSAKTETCFPDRVLLQPCNVKFIFLSVAISGVVYILPIPVAAQSKAWVSGRSLSGTDGSNSARAWRYVRRECCVL